MKKGTYLETDLIDIWHIKYLCTHKQFNVKKLDSLIQDLQNKTG